MGGEVCPSGRSFRWIPCHAHRNGARCGGSAPTALENPRRSRPRAAEDCPKCLFPMAARKKEQAGTVVAISCSPEVASTAGTG